MEFTNRSTSVTRTKKNLKLYLTQLWVHAKFTRIRKEKVTPKNNTIKHFAKNVYEYTQFNSIHKYFFTALFARSARMKKKKPGGFRNQYVQPVIES